MQLNKKKTDWEELVKLAGDVLLSLLNKQTECFPPYIKCAYIKC